MPSSVVSSQCSLTTQPSLPMTSIPSPRVSPVIIRNAADLRAYLSGKPAPVVDAMAIATLARVEAKLRMAR